MTFVAGIFCFVATARADVRVPALFSDHMVLQQEIAAPVWGWAEPGEAVTVTLGDQKLSATAAGNGGWRVEFGKLAAGGPLTLTISGRNTISIKDVLVGEVWLGSGQSNMGMNVHAANHLEQEKAAANLPQIRVFTERSASSTKPSQEPTGQWVVCSPETVEKFSATAYFFGRDLHRELKVPVGLIVSAVGGTPIESWIAADVQHAEPKLNKFFELQSKDDKEFDERKVMAAYEKNMEKWREKAAEAKKNKQPVPRQPRNPLDVRGRKKDVGGLFNGKIAPLVGYGIRGAIWYQGEANSTPEKAEFYQVQLPMLVKDWRSRWGREFPFAWVQLPNFISERGEGWMIVREAMLKTLALPKTGMAVTIDVGDPKNIHPGNKQEVGRRLSLWALATVYCRDIEYSGPMLAGNETRGNEIVLRFTHADGLKARDAELRGFEIADADKTWHPAQARIESTTIVVSSSEVSNPTAVRYAWKDDTDANLVNGAGLPASPFRTAEW